MVGVKPRPTPAPRHPPPRSVPWSPRSSGRATDTHSPEEPSASAPHHLLRPQSRLPPSTGSIAGPGIAVSRACRRSEGCQAGSQSGDQFLLLLDRSDQGGDRHVGFDVPGGVDGHMMSGAILKVEQPFAREGQDQRPPLANREVDKAMVSTSMPSPPLGPNNARIAGHARFSSQNIIFGRQQQSAAVRIEVGSKPCGHPNNLCISKL